MREGTFLSRPKLSRTHFSSHQPSESVDGVASPSNSFTTSRYHVPLSGFGDDTKKKAGATLAFGYSAGIVVLVLVASRFGSYAVLFEKRLIELNEKSPEMPEVEELDVTSVEEEGEPKEPLVIDQTIAISSICSDTEMSESAAWLCDESEFQKMKLTYL
jgi:hypothetical protein